MVFSGIPSNACAGCRKRRIKVYIPAIIVPAIRGCKDDNEDMRLKPDRLQCDQMWSGCTQCMRAGKTCPGYRDQLALRFRDQTRETAQKVRFRREEVTLKTRCAIQPLSADAGLAHATLISSLDDQAFRFFVRNYVTEPSPAMDWTANDYSMISYGSGSAKRSNDAVISIGLTCLSNVKNNSAMMMYARSKSASALTLTMTALENPTTATQDATLIGVLLLALFEFISSERPSMEPMKVHINGLVALIKARGNRAIKPVVARLLMQLSSFMLVSCLQGKYNIPPAVYKTFKPFWASYSHLKLPAWQLSEIASRLVEVRMSLQDGKPVDNSLFIQAVLTIEHDLAKWSAELPSSWAFHTVVSGDQTPTYEGHSHISPNLPIAKIWNYYRCVRMITNDLLLEHSTALPATPNQGKLRLRCLLTLSRMRRDICASVPFTLHYFESGGKMPAPTASPAFSLLWPLRFAASSRGASQALQDWIIGTLHHIGQTMGIDAAFAVATKLKDERDDHEPEFFNVDDWPRANTTKIVLE